VDERAWDVMNVRILSLILWRGLFSLFCQPEKMRAGGPETSDPHRGEAV